ncbi:MAG: hypothetical protein ABMA13_18060 [Chthoniobacteraceae bacterium]
MKTPTHKKRSGNRSAKRTRDLPRLSLRIPFRVPDFFAALEGARSFADRRQQWHAAKARTKNIRNADAFTPCWTNMPAPSDVPWLTVNFDPAPQDAELQNEAATRWKSIAGCPRSVSLATKFQAEWDFESLRTAEDCAACASYELARESATIRALVAAFRIARSEAVEAGKSGDSETAARTNLRWNALFSILLRVLRSNERLALVMAPGFPEKPWMAHSMKDRPRPKPLVPIKTASVEPLASAFLPYLFGAFGSDSVQSNGVHHFALSVDTTAPRKAIETVVKKALRAELDSIGVKRKHSPSTPGEILHHLAKLRLLRLVKGPIPHPIPGFESGSDESSWRRDARKVGSHLHSFFALPDGERPLTPHREADIR